MFSGLSMAKKDVISPTAAAPARQRPEEIDQSGSCKLRLSKKQKQKKNEYLKKLQDENQTLKAKIMDIQSQISTTEAQNSALLQQLKYFQMTFPACKGPEPGSSSPQVTQKSQ